jgi:hypothetical protein
MSETPSWLQGGNGAPEPAPDATAPSPVGSMNVETTNAATTSTTDDAADAKDLPSIILMMRLLNMGVAGALIAISVRILLAVFIIVAPLKGIFKNLYLPCFTRYN